MKTREAAKQERRDRILQATERLIRSRGDLGFSMRELAKDAGVSFATPFNLLGSKAGILGALVSRRIQDQYVRMELDHDHPIERVFGLGRLGARAYTQDAPLFRPLLHGLPELAGRSEDSVGFLQLGGRLWEAALADVVAERMMEEERDPESLARCLHVLFRGALMLWASGEMDAGEFEAHVEYGIAAHLIAVLEPSARSSLLDRLAAAEPRVSQPPRLRTRKAVAS